MREALEGQPEGCPRAAILLGRGGVIVDAVSTGAGGLSSAMPRVGDRVESGAPIAMIVNSEVVEAVAEVRDVHHAEHNDKLLLALL